MIVYFIFIYFLLYIKHESFSFFRIFHIDEIVPGRRDYFELELFILAQRFKGEIV